MRNFDVFNGDADGICALIQLRLAEPRTAHLITGVKRDINLLPNIQAQAGDQITALDISMRTNADGLKAVLDAGAFVFYVDHHNAGDIPAHENLVAMIDTRPDICTALLVNKYLNHAFPHWAITAAFGDNMQEPANTLAQKHGLSVDQTARLKAFGEVMNYNGYGRDVHDLHFAPADLYQSLAPYHSPFDLFADNPKIEKVLTEGYANDLSRATSSPQISQGIYILDDDKWARRISGSFGNVLSRQNPDQAHAVLTHNLDNTYTVSIRAPRNHQMGADTLALSFATGGGRKAAAGINALPKHHIDLFVERFTKAF